MAFRDKAVANMLEFVKRPTPYKLGGGRPISMANCLIEGDCSGSVIAACEDARPGSTGGASYTGDMRECFTSTGLWRWHDTGDGYVAKPGDVYLFDGANPGHTAMCTCAVPDLLAELYPPQARQVEYYDYTPMWSGKLEYIGDDDVDPDIRYMQNLAAPMCQRAEIDAPVATGEWDVQTQNALVHMAQVQMLSEMDPTLYPSGEIGGQSRAVMDAHPVGLGDSGLACWAVKAALVGHGYKGADIDGTWTGMDLTSWEFDAVADSALRRFQSDNPPLTVSGKADASTWCTLCPNCYSDNTER